MAASVEDLRGTGKHGRHRVLWHRNLESVRVEQIQPARTRNVRAQQLAACEPMGHPHCYTVGDLEKHHEAIEQILFVAKPSFP